jgi:allophanate hydrolase
MSVPATFDLTSLRAAYASGATTPEEVALESLRRAEDSRHPHVWIQRLDRDLVLGYARALPPLPEPKLPLYGLPFAIKDNIDLAAIPTTAACPDFAYIPTASAAIVDLLIAAGAIPIGKTNLDQFATGLTGARSPYGAPECVFHSEFISGGSSSGSAVAVAAGMVSFALGTDTAGSGRVPAAFNHIVGHKPTRGLWSCRGVFPACRSLDCPTVFSLSCYDARAVLDVLASFDPADPFSRPAPARRAAFPERFRFGVLRGSQRQFFGDSAAADLYERSVTRLAACGGEPVEFDYAPFASAAALLYAGPWVAERRWAVGDFFDTHPDSMHPVVRQVISAAAKYDAVAAFDAQYRLGGFAQMARKTWESVDLLLLPTTGTIYRLDEVLADPIQLNSNLGWYTNFVNLLDLSALAVPAGFRENGLPFGVTLIAPAFYDHALLALGARLHRALGGSAGATPVRIDAQPLPVSESRDILLAVVGAHLRGQPLNHQLTSRGARFVREARTAPCYRLYALPNTQPAKPGLVRVPGFAGPGIELEVWSLGEQAFGSFVAEVPSPMVIGSVELEDGSIVKSFLCEPWSTEGGEDVTSFGGWLAYRRSMGPPSQP